MLRAGLARPFVKHKQTVNDAEFDTTGTLVVTAATDGRCHVIDTTTMKPVSEFVGEKIAMFYRSHFSPDGERIASTDHIRGNVYLWRTRTGEAITKPMKHGPCVGWSTFSPDGKTLATATGLTPGGGGLRPTMRLWQVASGEAIGDPIRLPDIASSLSYSSDGELLLVSCNDGTVELFDAHKHGRCR